MEKKEEEDEEREESKRQKREQEKKEEERERKRRKRLDGLTKHQILRQEKISDIYDLIDPGVCLFPLRTD